MKNILLSLLSIITVLSCETINTLEDIDELTVLAYLHANEYLDTVRFGKVIPLDVSESPSAPENLAPVIVAENGDVYPLTYTGVDGAYLNQDLWIEEGKSYTLEVRFQDKSVAAEAFVPPKPQGLTLSDTVITRNKIIDFSDIQNLEIPDPIALSWSGDEGAFYFVQVRNTESDPEPINELFSGENLPPRPDFLSEPSSNPYYDINAFTDITHYGTYEVIVFRVNPEYMTLYEDNTSGAGSLNEIRTNVQNGFGIFTGINSEKIYFEVKKP